MHHKMVKIADQLLCEIDKQMECLEEVSTQELGEVIDMVKDLSEAIYYDVITESMLGTEELGEKKHYIEKYIPETMTVHPSSEEYDGKMMGHSPIARKAYMKSKTSNKDKTIKLKELEKYLQELTAELMEMIEGASEEEKQLLERKIAVLHAKITTQPQ